MSADWVDDEFDAEWAFTELDLVPEFFEQMKRIADDFWARQTPEVTAAERFAERVRSIS